MTPKRWLALWLVWIPVFWSAVAFAQPAGSSAVQPRAERALLIGIDDFVSKPSAYPSSTNNVYAMQEMFQQARNPLTTLLLPDAPVTSAKELAMLIHDTFGDARDGDVSYLYISTHGLYDPANGVEPALLLSDGMVESSIRPQELEAAFDGIAGTKVLILDACNSGAFIGKGMASRPDKVYFQRDDFKVLCSSGAMEESWYWSARQTDGETEDAQGAFYFTQALCDALSAENGYPADRNRDGVVTLLELYDYLLLNHAASTPQVYPQSDGFELFGYDLGEPMPAGLERSPIMDVTFSGTLLDQSQREITIEYIAMRPVRVAYQIVYQREHKWEFQNAQLIYDEAERFTAFGDQEGAVSAGRKVRTLNLNALPSDAYGYVLIQLVSIEQGKLRVHAGRVLCVLPGDGEQALSVQAEASLKAGSGQELAIFVAHDYPCALSVSVVDMEGRVVHRMCHRSSTRPMQLVPEGTTLYWNGLLKDGQPAPAGSYRIRAQVTLNDQIITAESETFEVIEGGA